MTNNRVAIWLLLGLAACALSLGVARTASAQVPLYYSGWLEEDGEPMEGPTSIQVYLFNDPTSEEEDALLCQSIARGDTEVTAGRFQIELSATCNDAFAEFDELFVEVVVEGNNLGRAPIGAVPFAVEVVGGGGDPGGIDLETVQAMLAELVPAGSIVPYGGETAPAGWLLCNGAEVSRTDFADLFAAIGTNYGQGNGSSTFNLPDFRGRFLRGVDNGAGIDPDAGDRVSLFSGGRAGDRVGSYQGDATATPEAALTVESGGVHSHAASSTVTDPGHTHTIHPITATAWILNGNPSNAQDISSDTETGSQVTGVTVSTTTEPDVGHAHALTGGDSETRPANVYVNWIIKE